MIKSFLSAAAIMTYGDSLSTNSGELQQCAVRVENGRLHVARTSKAHRIEPSLPRPVT